MATRFSLEKFTDENDIKFNPVEYSKFKFGSKDIARKFGMSLAAGFISSPFYQAMIETVIKRGCRIVVMSSPYVHVPTATFAMKDYFIRDLNQQLVEDGIMPVIEAKIYRSSSYKEEYGEMTKEQRFEVMKGDVFHVDKSLLDGNVCLFMDDIVITGAHEHRVETMMNHLNVQPALAYFLYFAELTSGKTNPVIENYLNYAYVKNLVRLDKVLKNGPCLLNTRVVKYILNAPHDECKSFMTYQKFTFLHTLYHHAIGNGYHLIDDYAENLAYLKSLVFNPSAN